MTADAINAASLAFKKALIERALSGEMNCHPGYPSGKAKPDSVTNQRNRKGAKLEDELIQTEAHAEQGESQCRTPGADE